MALRRRVVAVVVDVEEENIPMRDRLAAVLVLVDAAVSRWMTPIDPPVMKALIFFDFI